MAPTTYPGKVPDGDYLLVAGTVEHRPFSSMGLRLDELGQRPLRGRSAVLAVGSNASPARLADKCGVDAAVPVARVRVEGWAAVYSAHISAYGSIASTLWADLESMTSLAVAFFDSDQLRLVDDTEPNYRRVDLGKLVDGWQGTVTGYRSHRGALNFGGGVIRLSEVPADSPLISMTQVEVLDEVARLSGLARDGSALAKGVATDVIPRPQILDWMASGKSEQPPLD